MTDQSDQRQESVADAAAEQSVDEPLLVDDVLLLLFQPSSGVIAGENTLFYVLGGAVIADLALRDLTEVEKNGPFASRVAARGDAPRNAILRSGWDYIAKKPRDVQTVLAAIGPTLRGDVLDRLVDDGHLRRERRKLLGFIPSETLELASGRRAELFARVRATLVDEAVPDTRTAAIAALLSASANLYRFDPEIPWTSAVIGRAKELEYGNWGATAVSTAVTQATIAAITGALVASAAANAAVSN